MRGPVPGTEQALSKCWLLLLTVIGAIGITEVSLVSKSSDISTPSENRSQEQSLLFPAPTEALWARG